MNVTLELVVRGAWVALALIHLTPAVPVVRPALLRALYGVEATSDLGVLLRHRAALFLAVVVLCLVALLDAPSRRAASVAVGLSVVSFLGLFLVARAPEALRTIAVVDAVALLPLAVVLLAAWSATPAAG